LLAVESFAAALVCGFELVAFELVLVLGAPSCVAADCADAPPGKISIGKIHMPASAKAQPAVRHLRIFPRSFSANGNLLSYWSRRRFLSLQNNICKSLRDKLCKSVLANQMLKTPRRVTLPRKEKPNKNWHCNHPPCKEAMLVPVG